MHAAPQSPLCSSLRSHVPLLRADRSQNIKLCQYSRFYRQKWHPHCLMWCAALQLLAKSRTFVQQVFVDFTLLLQIGGCDVSQFTGLL